MVDKKLYYFLAMFSPIFSHKQTRQRYCMGFPETQMWLLLLLSWKKRRMREMQRMRNPRCVVSVTCDCHVHDV